MYAPFTRQPPTHCVTSSGLLDTVLSCCELPVSFRSRPFVACVQTDGKGKKNLWREQKSRPRKAQLTPREELEAPPTERADDDKSSVSSVRSGLPIVTVVGCLWLCEGPYMSAFILFVAEP